MKEINDIEKNISKLNETLEKLTENISPILDISNMGNTIEKLKNSIPTVETEDSPDSKDETNDEGETCMHNNSWHSNCSDCEELNTIDDIFTLVENTPNDMELGKKIRQIYFCYKNDNADSGDEPTDEQLNLFD